MPFPTQVPRPFTEDGIGSLSDGQEGCYGLFRSDDRCAYIGRSIDIKRRLLEHLRAPNACISINAPTYFYGSMPGKGLYGQPTLTIEELEVNLILEYMPLCAEQVG